MRLLVLWMTFLAGLYAAGPGSTSRSPLRRSSAKEGCDASGSSSRAPSPRRRPAFWPGRLPLLGGRDDHAGGARAPGRALRVAGGQKLAWPRAVRRDCHPARAGAGASAPPLSFLHVAARHPGDRSAPARGPRVRGHGGARPAPLRRSRAAAHRRQRRDLSSRLFPHTARDPSPHRVRVRARGEPGAFAPAALLPGAPRLDARRPGPDRDSGLHPLHVVHRRVRSDRGGSRRPHLPDAEGGGVSGALLPRPGDRHRLPRPALPSEPARDPLQRRGRRPRPRRPGEPPLPRGAAPRPLDDDAGGRLRGPDQRPAGGRAPPVRVARAVHRRQRRKVGARAAPHRHSPLRLRPDQHGRDPRRARLPTPCWWRWWSPATLPTSGSWRRRSCSRCCSPAPCCCC